MGKLVNSVTIHSQKGTFARTEGWAIVCWDTDVPDAGGRRGPRTPGTVAWMRPVFQGSVMCANG